MLERNGSFVVMHATAVYEMYFIESWNICITKVCYGLTLFIFFSFTGISWLIVHSLLLDDQRSEAEVNTFPPSAWYNASGHLSLVSLDQPILLKQKLNSYSVVSILRPREQFSWEDNHDLFSLYELYIGRTWKFCVVIWSSILGVCWPSIVMTG